MVMELKQIIDKNYILKIAKQESELKALQAQINPHFLYNTLNYINAYAQIHNVIEITNMTHALADIFRYCTKNDQSLVKVSEEVDHVKNYMYIQNIRYNNNIEFSIDIPDEIVNLKVAKFILQPLIENAVNHGVKHKKGIKTVSLRAEIIEEKLMFIIADNGLGISGEMLNEINNRLYGLDVPESKRKEEGTNIGLFNVNQRIKIMFGEQYGLKVNSIEGLGTEIKIILPMVF